MSSPYHAVRRQGWPGADVRSEKGRVARERTSRLGTVRGV